MKLFKHEEAQILLRQYLDKYPKAKDSNMTWIGPSQDEYFDAGRRTPLLRRLAEETGGRFYTPSTVSNLPEDLRFTGAGVTLTEERDLWDMPIVLILVLGLLGTEWGYRRIREMV